MPSVKIQGVLDTIGALSVIEFNELTKALQKLWDVNPAVSRTPVAEPDNTTKPVEIEQTEFAVVIKEAGPLKISVIKAVREVVPGLGLKEAKDLVDNAPSTVAENLSKADANRIKEKFEVAGAIVELE